LIRNDLSTIWCELTSSIRTRPSGETVGVELRFCPQVEKNDGCYGEALSEDRKVSSANSISSKDGDSFKKAAKESASTSKCIPSLDETQAATSPPMSVAAKKNRPPKKRKYESDDESQAISNRSFRKSRSGDTRVEEIDEKSAVESMLELAKNTL